MNSRAAIQSENKAATRIKTQIAMKAPVNSKLPEPASYDFGARRSKTPAPANIKPLQHATNLRILVGKNATNKPKQATQKSKKPIIPRIFGFVPIHTTWYILPAAGCASTVASLTADCPLNPHAIETRIRLITLRIGDKNLRIICTLLLLKAR